MIYLDAAATTFRKPPEVERAMLRAMRTMSSVGRGSYGAAQKAEETAYRCRALAAEMFGAASGEQVVFTMNATHGLNIAIKTLLRRGGRAIISGYEHNAVTRPLHALGAEIITAGAPLFDASSTVEAFASALHGGADAVICTQVSNVFGFVLPIAEIAALCRSAGVPLIVDASQGAGVLPVDCGAWGADFVAMPGHKGLYGPQGTGVLLCARTAEPLIEGGTGSESLRQEMPEFLPDRLEAGTHNMPGLAGLLAGLSFVQRTGIGRIAQHERALTQYAAGRLSELGGVRVFFSQQPERQTGVLSFTVSGRDPTDLTEALGRRGIAVRGGLHCAPLGHETAGTLPAGTVRVSFSAFSKKSDVDALCSAAAKILSE